MASLHPQLAKDTFTIGRFDLCLLLLMNDASYPWFILVPDRENVTEIYQLDIKDQQTLLDESSYLAAKLAAEFNADKMNIAALGNIVPQLHIHHIVRYKNDPVWPDPVWGKIKPVAYTDQEISDVKTRIQNILQGRLAGPAA